MEEERRGEVGGWKGGGSAEEVGGRGGKGGGRGKNRRKERAREGKGRIKR